MNVFDLTLLSSTMITETCCDMRLLAHEMGEIHPGQFVAVKCDGFTLRRPISVCDYDGEILRLLVDQRGDGTRWLTGRPKMSTLSVLGPLGRGFELSDGKTLVVGGGIGTPPLVYAAKNCKSADAILGFRNACAVMLVDTFREVCDTVQVCTDDGSFGAHARVDSLLTARLTSTRFDRVLACGPTPMLGAIAEVCERFSTPLQVSMEERMGCGVGACLVCSCKVADANGYRHARVCKDGPVFDASEVIFNG